MRRFRLAALPLLFAVLAATAAAAPPHRAPPGHAHDRAPWRFDNRYHHDHYYPRLGYPVPVLPGGAVSVYFGGGNYFFHGGAWYRPSGGRFIVVMPPVGIVVPLLPPGYVSLRIGGAPYYYANDVYYVPVPEGYRVVPPPPQADEAKPAPLLSPRPAPEPIIYPRKGQSAEQTEIDRRECNKWATSQPNAVADASVFQRAVEACLDGRGYTVR